MSGWDCFGWVGFGEEAADEVLAESGLIKGGVGGVDSVKPVRSMGYGE